MSDGIIAFCFMLLIWILTDRLARGLVGVQAAIKEVALQIRLLREDDDQQIKCSIAGDCGRPHASVEEWQKCRACEEILQRRLKGIA